MVMTQAWSIWRYPPSASDAITRTSIEDWSVPGRLLSHLLIMRPGLSEVSDLLAS